MLRWFRYILVAALLLVAIVVLTHRPRNVAVVPEGVIRIQYWEKWSGDEARQMRIIVDDFNATVGKEKGIFVDYISMSSVDQKTLVATAAGVPPDIAGLWDAQLFQFAEMDALEPLDDLAREFGIGPETYKPVYWNGCNYKGKLWGLVSTPAAIVLHYNKQMIEDGADSLRKAGLDPTKLPATIDELDRYAEALTTYEVINGKRMIKASGHIPLEPGWYVQVFAYWFGGSLFNEETQELTLTEPRVVQAYDWVASYSRKFGKDSISDFRSGLGQFASAQNAFLVDKVALEQQGPWMSNYIELNAPQMNRWRVPAEKLQREKDFNKLRLGMTFEQVEKLLGAFTKREGDVTTWDAGIKSIRCAFVEGKLTAKSMEFLPAEERRKMTQWGVAPFPSAVPGLGNVAFCAFDVLVIPKGSKHKREAFEFIAYVNRQEVMEKLNMLHCKNSPLRAVSDEFIDKHPNPYIGVFEECASSPNAFGVPKIPIWPEVTDELGNVSQQCYLLEKDAESALKIAAERLGKRWDYFRRVQAERAAR